MRQRLSCQGVKAKEQKITKNCNFVYKNENIYVADEIFFTLLIKLGYNNFIKLPLGRLLILSPWAACSFFSGSIAIFSGFSSMPNSEIKTILVTKCEKKGNFSTI